MVNLVPMYVWRKWDELLVGVWDWDCEVAGPPLQWQLPASLVWWYCETTALCRAFLLMFVDNNKFQHKWPLINPQIIVCLAFSLCLLLQSSEAVNLILTNQCSDPSWYMNFPKVLEFPKFKKLHLLKLVRVLNRIVVAIPFHIN